MSEWEDTTLGEFVSLQRGHDLTDPERKQGCVPVMGSAGQNGTHATALAKGPGVVIGRSGASFGQVHFTEKDYWPHNTCLYVTDFHGNDPRFAYYFLKSINFAGYNSGSAQPSLNRNFIYPIEVRIPKPDVQREIAHILGTLDDKIELNRRMNETLEAMARAIFQSWFVDFDPVRAKASGESADSICQRLGLTPELLALFPDSFEDSELGEIPKGWHTKSFSEAITINPTRTLKKGVVAPYLDMANMPTASARARDIVVREFGSGMKFQNGDTLVARITPCLENGKTCFVDFLNERQVGWGSTEYIVLRPSTPLPPEYGYFLARTEKFRDHAIANMTGTSGRQRVPANAFNDVFLVIPGAEVASAFGSFAQATMASMRSRDMESQTLTAMRDSLLPKLLSGELSVTKAVAELGA